MRPAEKQLPNADYRNEDPQRRSKKHPERYINKTEEMRDEGIFLRSAFGGELLAGQNHMRYH